MLVLVVILGIFAIVGVSTIIWKLLGYLKPSSNIIGKSISIATFFAFVIFIIVLRDHTTPYFKDIDPFVEPCYSPISYKDSYLLIAMHLLALFSMFALYFREYELPPIQIVIYFIFLTIGVIVNAQFLYQISFHDTSRIYLWKQGDDASGSLAAYPILLIVSSIGIAVIMIQNKAKLNQNTKYKNKWLNSINKRLIELNNLPLLGIILTMPILLIFVLILVLFGQDIDSLTRVYTETATWKLSKHIHPPTVDDRHGHYLCTVAALGSPRLVKPIAMGIRNNRLILVNRQLQIANAFEFMIQEISPKAHQVIRTCYDKYGLNLSKKINTEYLSNLTYVLMKPLEWVFLISLYIFYVNPENVIRNQYSPLPNKN